MGFLHGQDRLWQMEFNRRAGQGRLAEVLGEAALPADRYLRTLGLARPPSARWPSCTPPTLALLEAYAAGVNAAIAGYGLALPPEFLLLRHRPEPWRPVDSLLFQKLMALDLSGNWREELLRARLAQRLTPGPARADSGRASRCRAPITMAALAGLPLDRLAAALPDPPPPGIGSNVWVADGSADRQRAAAARQRPASALQTPGHWYLAQLEAPGPRRDRRHPAGPAVRRARPQPDIAWGFTNTGSDTQDLFVERLDPADPGRYLTPAGSAPFQTRERDASRCEAGQPVTLRCARPGMAR